MRSRHYSLTHERQRLTLDLIEHSAKPHTLRRIDHLYKLYPPLQVGLKCLMSPAVLALGPVAKAIVQDRLQAIKVRPDNIDPLIRDQSSKPLSHALAHDPGFSVMHGKSFFHQHRGSMRCKSLRASLEGFIARKRKVIGIARILRARRLRESTQTAIDSIGADIGQRRRSGRALRHVWTGI